MAGLSQRFQELFAEGKISKMDADNLMVESETRKAREDLQSAERSSEGGDFKWATVQAYYTMFHAARALVFTKGYREKSHRALAVALEDLYAGELEPSLTDDFRRVMKLREEADYEGTYSELAAKECINDAEVFLARCEEIAAGAGTGRRQAST